MPNAEIVFGLISLSGCSVIAERSLEWLNRCWPGTGNAKLVDQDGAVMARGRLGHSERCHDCTSRIRVQDVPDDPPLVSNVWGHVGQDVAHVVTSRAVSVVAQSLSNEDRPT